MPFYNSSYLYLDFKYKVSSHFPIATLLSIDKIDSSSKQRGEGKITQTELIFSKDSSKDFSSMSIPIYPDFFGASYFQESNITDFLDSYN